MTIKNDGKDIKAKLYFSLESFIVSVGLQINQLSIQVVYFIFLINKWKQQIVKNQE